MPKQLLPGESLVLQPLRRHWIVLVRAMAAPVLVAAILLVLVDGLLGTVGGGDLHIIFTLTVVALLGFWALLVWAEWSAFSLTVTDQRVIMEQGILIRRSKVLPLDRVQDVTTVQTVLGRLLNYGNVEIDAIGAAGVERFPFVSSPEMLRDQVFMLSEQLRRGL
ncbi:MAG TPA: PH domain-containing protein [Candidatus Dormibacteraeota bacterium]|nr:PH domain-containing protein [Candidatus Dormibacteraeota bacterium]